MESAHVGLESRPQFMGEVVLECLGEFIAPAVKCGVSRRLVFAWSVSAAVTALLRWRCRKHRFRVARVVVVQVVDGESADGRGRYVALWW